MSVFINPEFKKKDVSYILYNLFYSMDEYFMLNWYSKYYC